MNTNSTELKPDSQSGQKRKSKKKLLIGILVIVVFVVLVMIFSGNGGSESGYADGLIEADNAFGLSTELTLEEFVQYYNESLVRALDLTDELSRQLNCINIDAPDSVIEEEGLIEYIYAPFNAEQTELQQNIIIGVDSETGYVVLAQIRFVSDAYNSAFTTDTARNAVDMRAYSIFYALNRGDFEKASLDIETWLDIAGIQWDNNIVYISGSNGDGIEIHGFVCCTEDAYREIFEGVSE